MDFGKTIAYIAFYLVSLAIFYYYLTTRNKERMSLIESGANPDMFNSPERYYMLFVIGMVAMGLAIGILVGYLFTSFVSQETSSLQYLMGMLFFGGAAMLVSFFIIGKWLKKSKNQ